MTQTLHARKKFEEQLHKLERQRVDIEDSLTELKRAIGVIDDAISKGQLAKPAHAHQVAAE